MFTINRYYNNEPGQQITYWNNSDFDEMLEKATQLFGPFKTNADYQKTKKQLYDNHECVKWVGPNTLFRVKIVSRNGFWGCLK